MPMNFYWIFRFTHFIGWQQYWWSN